MFWEKRLLARIICLGLIVILVSSCGSLQRMAIGAGSDLLYEASTSLEEENNWETFKEGVPGNLKLMEVLLSAKPQDEKLLVNLSRGYAGYAFGINETLYLKDLYPDQKDFSSHKEQAIVNYSKALKYGLRFLKLNGIDQKDLTKNMRKKDGIKTLLENNLSNSDHHLIGVLFTGQSLAGLINLYGKDKMALAGQLPVAKGLFDWVCGKNRNISHGACDIFYGTYEVSKPFGNRAKADGIFKKFFKENPHNWLARMVYIQFFIMEGGEEEDWEKQKVFMRKAASLFQDKVKWMPGYKNHKVFENPNLGFYQAMALKRFSILDEIVGKYKDDIF